MSQERRRLPGGYGVMRSGDREAWPVLDGVLSFFGLTFQTEGLYSVK